MQVAKLSREEFVEWLAGEKVPGTKSPNSGFFKQNLNRDLVLLWLTESEVTKSSPVILVDENYMPDFYAFVSTYVSTYKPFSAFFNVLPFQNIGSFLPINSKKHTVCIIPDEFIGVAIAEAFIQSGDKIASISNLSVQGLHASLSATLISALNYGVDEATLKDITKKWIAVRNSNAEKPLRIDPFSILELWLIVSSVFSGRKGRRKTGSTGKIIKCLESYFDKKLPFEVWFMPVANSIKGLEDKVIKMSHSREARITAFFEAFQIVQRAKIEPIFEEFILGGLLAMVGEGSFKQLKIFNDGFQLPPMAALWFGIISSGQKQSDALTEGNCLGRRALRELKKAPSIFSTPNYDLSFEEYSIYGGLERQTSQFHVGRSGIISVSLLGPIKSVFRDPKNSKKEVTPTRSHGLDGLNHEKIDELVYLAGRLNSAVKEIYQPKQRDLFRFEDKRKRRL